MPLRRLRRLARKARDRTRPAQSSGGSGFSRAQDGAMAALDLSSEGAFAVLGAAVVSSWEVALTDVSRALRGRIDEGRQVELIECMSDALVPTETPFSGLGKRYSHAVKMGTRAGLDSGKLSDATAPLGEAIGVLGSAAAQGWPKTVNHMEPVLEALSCSKETRAALLDQGPRLQQALDDAWRNYMTSLERLAQAPDLEAALVDGIEAWKDEAARAVELMLYESRGILVEAVEALP